MRVNVSAARIPVLRRRAGAPLCRCVISSANGARLGGLATRSKHRANSRSPPRTGVARLLTRGEPVKNP
jgi:hypothetical protein